MKLTAAPRRTILTAGMIGGRRLWLDKSPALVLACCSCSWRRPTATDAGGWRLAAAHLRTVHRDEPGAKMCETIARKT